MHSNFIQAVDTAMASTQKEKHASGLMKRSNGCEQLALSSSLQATTVLETHAQGDLFTMPTWIRSAVNSLA